MGKDRQPADQAIRETVDLRPFGDILAVAARYASVLSGLG